MKVRDRLRLFSLLLSLLLALSLCAVAQDSATSQIKAEIARLQQSIKDKPVTDKDLAPIANEAENALKAASAAIDSARLYLALENLGQAEDLLQAARTGADKAEVEKGGLSAFQSKWGKVSLRLTALDREAHAQQWNHTPLAVQALAEAAQGKAIPLLEGGQGFAVATGPKEGLLYVGQAEGEADFAAFCTRLAFGEKKASPFPSRSLLPELQSLQTKTNAAFQPPKSIDLHSRFIALNSQLKLARELDASKFYAGALYAYLEAVRHYGMLDAPAVEAAQQAKLKQELEAERKKLNASSADDSLAQLFLQRAESYTAHADGSATSEIEWKGARVILDQVLPAYFAAKKPATPVEMASGKRVEITLVRWPYT
jgi:hypothetical protein